LFAFFAGGLVGHKLNEYEILLTVDGLIDALYLVAKFSKEESPLAFCAAMVVYSFYMAVVSFLLNKKENKTLETTREDIPDCFIQIIDIEN